MHNVTMSPNSTYALEAMSGDTAYQSDVQQADLPQHRGPDLFLYS